jgi:hypothetical protein
MPPGHPPSREAAYCSVRARRATPGLLQGRTGLRDPAEAAGASNSSRKLRQFLSKYLILLWIKIFHNIPYANSTYGPMSTRSCALKGQTEALLSFAPRHSNFRRRLSLMVFAGSSPITTTSPSSKARPEVLSQHYPDSTVIRPRPTPAMRTPGTCGRNIEPIAKPASTFSGHLNVRPGTGAIAPARL